MIRTVVIDDEENARRAICNMLRLHCPEIRVAGEAWSVESGLAVIRDTDPELVFLDVEMPDGTGFDLLKLLPAVTFPVIFITAHEQYALQAIKFSALDYLLKPVHPGELANAVSKALNSGKEEMALKLGVFQEHNSGINTSRIIINTANKIYLLDTEEVIRCEANVNYTLIVTAGEERILTSRPLKELDELLSGKGFFRIHQSHLINLAHLRQYLKGEGGEVILRNGDHVPVSSRRRDQLLRRINRE